MLAMAHILPALFVAGLLIASILSPSLASAQPDFVGQATAIITGTVHAPDGAALANAEVTAYPGISQRLDAVGPVQADSSGRYSINVPPGRYTVVAKLDGYTQRTLDPFDVQSALGPRTADVSLYPNDASITGTVTDGDSGSAAPAGTIVDLVVQTAHEGAPDAMEQNAVVVGSSPVNPDGSFSLYGASGRFYSVGVDYTGDKTAEDTTYALRSVELRPYVLGPSNNPPLVFVLPTLTFSTPGCVSSRCTLDVSGTGWLAGSIVGLVLLRCNDAYCNVETANPSAGQVTADAAGRIEGSVRFDAPPDGMYQVEAYDSREVAAGQIAQDLQTLATYSVTTHSP
jgi:hypothetical protein